jgi:MFS family permease
VTSRAMQRKISGQNELGKSERGKKIAVIVSVSLSSLLTSFMGASVIVALPTIGREFRMDPVSLSWIVTAFLLGLGIFLLPMGRFADIHGRKATYLIGLSLFGVMSVACAHSHSWPILVLCRFAQGAASAMTWGTGIAILNSVSSESERGKINAIGITTAYLGLSIAPFLGGVLAHQFGWRYIFLSGVPIVPIIIGIMLITVRQEWAEAKGEAFDYVGAVIYAGILIALIRGMTWMPSVLGLISILLGAAGVILFLRWETAFPYPMLNLDLFRGNKLFAFSNLAGVISYAATYAVAFLLSLYLQSIRAMSAQTAGFILVSQPIVQSAFSYVAGKMSDTREPSVVASVGMSFIVAGLFLLSFLSQQTGISFIVMVLGVLGLGFALFAAPNANAVMAAVKPKFLGVASATMICTGTVGQVLSMGITSLILSIYVGGVSAASMQPVPLLRGMKLLFVVFAVISIVGLFVSLKRGKVH